MQNQSNKRSKNNVTITHCHSHSMSAAGANAAADVELWRRLLKILCKKNKVLPIRQKAEQEKKDPVKKSP